ncbi:hypothetical protein N7520_005472 [Penicillium odoratum]|uniref:uncharacterized protein n=1 Tax=Penicillium odoratum TaxID=1167516 RepID=UPI002546A9E2|nr:uncharacterized protein N7520_005472 [Penicillium odoratum]KAJ5765913.1 hypothetical protein N7520_005472 [Penicillium odoratum]
MPVVPVDSSKLSDTESIKICVMRYFALPKKFFALNLDEKKKHCGARGRGYELIGSQALEPGTKPDLKEGYFVGRDDPTRKPPFRDFEHPNVWPTTAIPDVEFKNPLVEYHKALSALSNQMMKLLARGLSGMDLNTDIINDFCHEPVASVRLLHYPPHPQDHDPELRGAGAHTDFGAITLLLQDVGSGLQVLNQKSLEWIDVPPNKYAYVVNVGDMLSYWTKGQYLSNIHRVINTSGTDRYSVPFFFDGNLDCELRALDGSNGKVLTVSDHLHAMYEKVYV